MPLLSRVRRAQRTAHYGRVDAGELAVEYRMRCFLGPESVRADNALALAAEAGRFDELRRALFAAQPPREPEVSRPRTFCVSAPRSD